MISMECIYVVSLLYAFFLVSILGCVKATKGYVTWGNVLLSAIGSAIPVFNIAILIVLLVEAAQESDFFKKKMF